MWLIGAVSPKPAVSDACCRPAGVPEQAWAWSHTQPVLWYALGMTIVVAGVGFATAYGRRRAHGAEPGGLVEAGT